MKKFIMLVFALVVFGLGIETVDCFADVGINRRNAIENNQYQKFMIVDNVKQKGNVITLSLDEDVKFVNPETGKSGKFDVAEWKQHDAVWSSSDKKIAKIVGSNKGKTVKVKIKGKGGKATITAKRTYTDSDGKEKSETYKYEIRATDCPQYSIKQAYIIDDAVCQGFVHWLCDNIELGARAGESREAQIEYKKEHPTAWFYGLDGVCDDWACLCSHYFVQYLYETYEDYSGNAPIIYDGIGNTYTYSNNLITPGYIQNGTHAMFVLAICDHNNPDDILYKSFDLEEMDFNPPYCIVSEDGDSPRLVSLAELKECGFFSDGSMRWFDPLTQEHKKQGCGKYRLIDAGIFNLESFNRELGAVPEYKNSELIWITK